jgi:hypothetical protein
MLGTPPYANFKVYKNDRFSGIVEDYWVYFDQYHRPVIIKENKYAAGDVFWIEINYDWDYAPAKDFTVKVYSR